MFPIKGKQKLCISILVTTKRNIDRNFYDS